MIQEFEFTANTPEGERKTIIVGLLTVVACVLVTWLLFGSVLHVVRPWLWVLVVVPSAIVFSGVVRRLQKQYLGLFRLRLDGHHLTVVFPDQTVVDLGSVKDVQLEPFEDNDKRARLTVCGSKDCVCISMRTGTHWNGRSTKRDFMEINKATIAITQALDS
ncbi:MAG: hypothetical protein UDB11_07825 [Peptococcaceae bacterium]|nr:hypothetical protein [Peptococcaceae bacterium]